MMRKLTLTSGLLAGAFVIMLQSPATRVKAQSRTTPAKPADTSAAAKIDPAKEAKIRQLMDVTGAKDLGAQLMEAGISQFRASVVDSQPDNPRAQQFADAFATRFQKHFDPRTLTETVVPIYDKYLSDEDLQGLIDYYQSPLGQRMLKVLPEVAHESQMAGFALGQKAAQETMDELRAEYPEFVPNAGDEDKHPAPTSKN
jgi:uncharacterized protein